MFKHTHRKTRGRLKWQSAITRLTVHSTWVACVRSGVFATEKRGVIHDTEWIIETKC